MIHPARIASARSKVGTMANRQRFAKSVARALRRSLASSSKRRDARIHDKTRPRNSALPQRILLSRVYMRLTKKQAAKVSSLAVLSVIAIAPLALTRCGPKERAPVVASAPSSAPSSSDTPATTASTVVPEPVTTTATTTTTAEAAPPASEKPPEKAFTGPIPKDCAALDAAVKNAAKDKACKKDDDCGGASVYCSCEFGMAERSIAKLRAMNKAWQDKECFKKGPPRPCATCAPPSPHLCKNGSCT
jgi:hypothetical protein